MKTLIRATTKPRRLFVPISQLPLTIRPAEMRQNPSKRPLALTTEMNQPRLHAHHTMAVGRLRLLLQCKVAWLVAVLSTIFVAPMPTAAGAAEVPGQPPPATTNSVVLPELI